VIVPKSLQWRLSLWLGMGLTLLWVVMALVTAQMLRHDMDAVFDSALEETGQRLLPLAVRDIVGRDSDDDASQSVATMREHDEYFTYVVRDAQGRVLLRSHKADLSVFPPFIGMGFADTRTHRIYFDAALQGTITIAVAEPLTRRSAVSREILLGLSLPLGLLVPVSLVGVWVLVRLSMQPLRRLRSDIELRGAGDLTPISAKGLPSEIQPNAIAVNRLLERLRRTLEAERSFAANSAHELRTPVAAALAQTQRLILETSDTAMRARAREIEAALHRLSRLSEKLMQLARAEGARLQTSEPTDLAAILEMVVNEMTASAGNARRINLVLPQAPALFHIDPDAYAILVRNLVENALKHGSQHEPVEVTLSGNGMLRFANAGTTIAPNLLASLSQPFERGHAQTEGMGLGLAIAKTIAAGIGGRIELRSPREGRQDGFEVRFFLGE